MLAAATLCKNEELLIAYTVYSLLDLVDFHVIVDTGSTDRTVELVNDLFQYEIKHGKIIFVSMPNKDFDMAPARNFTLDTARKRGAEYLIHADADMVFYPEAIRALRHSLQTRQEKFRYIFALQYELYQYKAKTQDEWIENFLNDPSFILDRDMTLPNAPRSPFQYRIAYCTDRAFAAGKWTDEAFTKGQRVEGVYHHEGAPEENLFLPTYAFAHYGWAKPVDQKNKKEAVWRKGQLGGNPRVDYLHKTDEAPFIVPFEKHPEVMLNNFPKVTETLGLLNAPH
jgi:glycosyltransferase involved in cell wall biosynthesis